MFQNYFSFFFGPKKDFKILQKPRQQEKTMRGARTFYQLNTLQNNSSTGEKGPNLLDLGSNPLLLTEFAPINISDR